MEPRECEALVPNADGEFFVYRGKMMLIKRIWMDSTDGLAPDPKSGDVDVMVEMENGEIWTAHFVTLPYLSQQLEMSFTVPDTAKIGFVALETPHVIVRDLDQETVEDVIYELMGLGTMESVFDLVIEPEANILQETEGENHGAL